MPKFRKIPVEIEARRIPLGASREEVEEISRWIKDNLTDINNLPDATVGWYQRYLFSKPHTKVIEIPTLEGVMEAVEGDWIIQGVAGEFYPCKNDIFEKTYEPV
jgi:hypothetical protein